MIARCSTVVPQVGRACRAVVAPRATGPAPLLPRRCAAPLTQQRTVATAAVNIAATAATTRTCSRRRNVRVCAGWGDPVDFKPAKVVSVSKAADGGAAPLYVVRLDVGDAIAEGYTKGGQYLQVKVNDCKPGFFAIASPPDPNNRGVLEFLIKAAGEAAEKLVACAPGATVDVSPVQGKGFPVEKLDGADKVLIFATGSGISPVKAVIESGALEGKTATLYWGTRSPAATAYKEAIPEWESAGVKVVQVFSEGEGGRYVQDAFASDSAATAAVKAAPSKVGVLLCGQKGMAEAIKGMMTDAGVDAGAILTNF